MRRNTRSVTSLVLVLPMGVGLLAFGMTIPRLQVESPDAAPESLPPRVLVRIGTPDLRLRNSGASSIDVSPDGQLLAATEMNSPVPRVSLFHVRTGHLVKRIIPPDLPQGWAQCVAFSPDRTTLAWGEITGEVALWDLARDALLFREKLHANGVSDVAFSPDGQVLASGGDDAAVYLVRLAAGPGEMIRRLETGEKNPARGKAAAVRKGQPHVGPLGLAFTPDGTRLVVGSGSSSTITVWRIADGTLVRRIEGGPGDPRKPTPTTGYVAVTPDGRRIVSVGQSIVPIEQTTIQYGPKNVNLSGVRVWDLATGERLADWPAADGHGFGYAALSRDGGHLAVADFSELRILDTRTGQVQRKIPLPGCWGARPRFSPDGTLVAMPVKNAVALFDVETGRSLLHSERTPEGEFASCAWSPAGDRVVTGHNDGAVRMWEATTGKLVWCKTLAPVISPSGYSARPAFVGFSGDGKTLVAAGLRDDPVHFRDGLVAVYDAATGALKREVEQQHVRWAALSPDGSLVVVATSHGAWDDAHLIGIEVATGRTRWNNPPPEQQAGFVQFAEMHFLPDGSAVDVATRDSEVIRFSALTGRAENLFLSDTRPPDPAKRDRRIHGQMVAAAFSADGGTLITSSGDLLGVWDVAAGTLRRKIPFPNPHGGYLALSPDGKTIATSEINFAADPGEDTIRLFDTNTGECTLKLEPGDDRASLLEFSPDGTKLLTGFHRSTAMIWDVRRGQATRGNKPE